jgi:large conductance mechanosensitive channel
MFRELRTFTLRDNFITRGSLFDLAVGAIIVAAFGSILNALVVDIVLPAIEGLVTLDFSNSFVGLSHAVTATNLADARRQGPVIAYGSFATIMVNFLIILFVLSLVVKAKNAFKKTNPATDPAPLPHAAP